MTATGHDLTPGEYLDLDALAATEDLELVARWVVEGFMHGLHTSPYVGFSMEFASHREYLPGDDLRHLNWKLFGRHEKLYVKQYDAETNLELHIVLDASGSMMAGERGLTKFRYASMLAAALAQLANTQRDAVGITLYSDRIIEHVKPRANPDQLMSILHAISNVREHHSAKSPQVLHEIAELMPRRGMVVVISDFYFDDQPLLSALNHFRHFGHEVLAFHVLEPIEHQMSVDGVIRFRDLETGEEIITQAHEIRDSFIAAVANWTNQLKKACMSRDIDYKVLPTSSPLESALWSYFTERAQLH